MADREGNPYPDPNPNPNPDPNPYQVKKACTKATMLEPPPEGYECKHCGGSDHWELQCPVKAAAKAEAMAKLEREAEVRPDSSQPQP